MTTITNNSYSTFDSSDIERRRNNLLSIKTVTGICAVALFVFALCIQGECIVHNTLQTAKVNAFIISIVASGLVFAITHICVSRYLGKNN